MATAAEVQTRDEALHRRRVGRARRRRAIDVVNPTTEEVIGRDPGRHRREDVDRAVRAARAAFEAWSQTPREERAATCRRSRTGSPSAREEIAATIAQELGMPLKLAPDHPGRAADHAFASMPG